MVFATGRVRAGSRSHVDVMSVPQIAALDLGGAMGAQVRAGTAITGQLLAHRRPMRPPDQRGMTGAP